MKIIIEINSVYNLDAITFLEQVYEEYGNESIEMFLCDFPYTFKGKKRVTANAWDLPIDDNRFFELAVKLLTPRGCIALTASQPFTSYLVMNHLEYFKYEWIWEKDNGSNFVSVQHQPFKVHESLLIFGKAPITYNKSENYMTYHPQMTEGKPYHINRMGMTENLATSKDYERTSGEYENVRFPRSVLKFNTEKGLHPNQKPTDLFEYMINTYTDSGDTVIDICAGSGTTAVASTNCNRNYIINDITLKYVTTSKDRLSV